MHPNSWIVIPADLGIILLWTWELRANTEIKNNKNDEISRRKININRSSFLDDT